MNEIAVVTAVAGAYDGRRRDVTVDGVDYLFYADEPSARLIRPPWQRRELTDEGHPRRVAKGPKLNPHRFGLGEYRYVIWVDGGIHIISPDFVGQIIDHLGECGLVLSPHWDGRNDAYGEATIRPPKYADEPLDEQVAHMRAVGYPGETGLYECGVMARDMADPEVEELGRYWEAEVMRWSYQDQVSLPYCLWALDFTPAILPRSFRDMGWVKVNGHRSHL